MGCGLIQLPIQCKVISLNTEDLIYSENVRKLSIKDSLLNEKGRSLPNQKLHNHPI